MLCAFAAALYFALFTPFPSMADGLESYRTSHDERIIRSRANTHGCLHGGRTCYDYKEIRNYHEDLSESERGNYEIGRKSEVRELHVVRKYRNVDTDGEVETTVIKDPHGRLRDVTIHTEIDDSRLKARNRVAIGVYEGGNNRTSVINTVRMKDAEVTK